MPNERLMCMDIESLKIPCDLNSRFYTLNGESTNIKDFAIELNNVYLKITLKEDN